MEVIDRLDALSDRYDALLCDIWGVIHNGRTAFAPAVAAITRWRAMGKTVVLVSNVPKPRDPIPGQLARLGVSAAAYDAIVTSGDAIRAELAARAPGPMLKIGPDHDAVLWDGLGLDRAPLQNARFIAISGLNDDATETPMDYAPLLAEARARDLELLCANPDIVVRVGDRLVWCAGAIARDYTALGGRVVMAGKPYAPIYALALGEVERLRGPTPTARILAIGDGIGTDVLGANGADLDCLFIASGMHGEALLTDGAADAAKIAAALAAEGARATFVQAALA